MSLDKNYEDECKTNLFLLALLQHQSLGSSSSSPPTSEPINNNSSSSSNGHSLASSSSTYDAILCPSAECLAKTKLDGLLRACITATSATVGTTNRFATPEALVELFQHHTIRFEPPLSQSFVTMRGLRGSFSDDLSSVGRAGLLGQVAVLSTLSWTPSSSAAMTREGGGNATAAVQTLNIFYIDDVLVEASSLQETLRRLQTFAQAAERQFSERQQSSSGAAPSAAHRDPAAHPPLPPTTPGDGTSGLHTTGGTNGGGGGGMLGKLWGSVATSLLSVVGTVETNKPRPAPTTTTMPPSTQAAVMVQSSGVGSTSVRRRSVITEQQDEQIDYPEFQRIMQLPEAAQAARTLHAFVTQLSSTSGTGGGSVASSSEKPSSSSSTASGTSPEALRRFSQQLVTFILKIPSVSKLTSPRSSNQGGGTTPTTLSAVERILREGIEKYLCVKLYSKIFAVQWQDKQRDAVLRRKLSMLVSYVDPVEHLECVEHLAESAHWAVALKMFEEMNVVKSPREKLACSVAVCEALHAAISDCKQHISGSKGAAAGGGSADEFLPALMYCVLIANPEHLTSNLSYMDHYRTRSLMEPEVEYVLTALQSAAEFWFSCQAAHLKMTEELFDTALGNTALVKSIHGSPLVRSPPLQSASSATNPSGAAITATTVTGGSAGATAASSHGSNFFDLAPSDPSTTLQSSGLASPPPPVPTAAATTVATTTPSLHDVDFFFSSAPQPSLPAPQNPSSSTISPLSSLSVPAAAPTNDDHHRNNNHNGDKQQQQPYDDGSSAVLVETVRHIFQRKPPVTFESLTIEELKSVFLYAQRMLQ